MGGAAVERIAVIDTETTWDNRLMSIGTVIADSRTLRPLDAKYHVLTPEYLTGGMFSHVLFSHRRLAPKICTREKAMAELCAWLRGHGVTAIFAYNAGFDHGHLPELSHLQWYDIMRLAAYRQFNPKIPENAPCFSTGRLKRGYGVEAVYRLLSGDCQYQEVHHALCDAVDELTIMRLLGHPIGDYIPL